MSTWEVTATFRGERIRTQVNFNSKAKAQAYADETKNITLNPIHA